MRMRTFTAVYKDKGGKLRTKAYRGFDAEELFKSLKQRYEALGFELMGVELGRFQVVGG